ncbi:NAD(P)H-binding protein [Nonomuraea rubra]|uniref:NAD(P)H-binding protein n=1 Tax=Nonomuraea rubra TaxID=46180 RepID=UPI0028B20ED4|nr:NAD(P)H-binding protein [Nonomuraea rubra]
MSRTAGTDLNEPASLRPALDGVRAVFLLPGYRDMRGLAAEFARAGVERVVLLSGQAAVATDTGNAISAYMIDSETAVRESGLAWTFLPPAAFMSTTLRWLPQLRTGDVVRDAFGDVPIAGIDPADIAAVGARALLEPGHEGRAYSLSGPETLLPADRLRILGREGVLQLLPRPHHWIGKTGGRFLQETTEGTLGGKPYYRLGVLGFSNIDRRYEWTTFDNVTPTAMTYRGDPIKGKATKLSIPGEFTDPGILGPKYQGKSIPMRTVITRSASLARPGGSGRPVGQVGDAGGEHGGAGEFEGGTGPVSPAKSCRPLLLLEAGQGVDDVALDEGRVVPLGRPVRLSDAARLRRRPHRWPVPAVRTVLWPAA